MRRGKELEQEARAAYEAHIGGFVTEAAFIIHGELDYVGVSPDGLVDEDGLVELKCPSSPHKHVAALIGGEHAKEYRWQIQGQMWVIDRKWCDAVSYDPRFPSHLRLAVTRVMRDDKAIAELERECKAGNTEVIELLERLRAMDRAA